MFLPRAAGQSLLASFITTATALTSSTSVSLRTRGQLWKQRTLPLRHCHHHHHPILFLRSMSSLPAAATAAEGDPSFPSFADLPHLHPTLRRNLLEKMKFTRMTEIQALTWEPASQGRDVLGRARTGTGKTVSFLLPALQQLFHRSKQNSDRNTIHMLVLSPTRELASQIYDEARKLTQGHGRAKGSPGGGGPAFSAQVVFGGSSRPKEVAALERQVPTLLVATPGRLRDHLENTNLRGGQLPLAQCFQKTSILVLDETDRLLDMGFQKEVNDIIRYLPSKENRQTLLFSATVPKEVKAVMAKTMKANFVTADCIHDQDPASHTNEQVEQRHVILPYKTRLVSGTLQVIWKVIADAKAQREPLKLIVFFTTANLVAYYAAVVAQVFGVPVLELHSRKSQSYRTKTADKFRAATEAILFTSDVSARGVDYPGVTNVIQVGMADSRESYIHRLGRTGRAGKVGEGLLVLCDLEGKFLTKLNGIDVPVHTEIQAVVDQAPDAEFTQMITSMMDQVRNAGDDDELLNKIESGYRSMLGFYNGKLSKQLGVKDPAILVDFVNEFAHQAGCAQLPGIEKKTIGKMGLRYTTGLNITGNMQRSRTNNNNNSKKNSSNPRQGYGNSKQEASGAKRKPQGRAGGPNNGKSASGHARKRGKRVDGPTL